MSRLNNCGLDWALGATAIICDAFQEDRLPEPQIIEKDGGIEVTLVSDPSEKLRRKFGTISQRLRNEYGINTMALRLHQD